MYEVYNDTKQEKLGNIRWQNQDSKLFQKVL